MYEGTKVRTDLSNPGRRTPETQQLKRLNGLNGRGKETAGRGKRATGAATGGDVSSLVTSQQLNDDPT
jgi:hypothetical protein